MKSPSEKYINGRIICPSSTEGSKGWRIHFEISDDRGKTWKMVGPPEARLSVLTSDRKKENAKAKPIYAIQPSIPLPSQAHPKVLARLCA